MLRGPLKACMARPCYVVGRLKKHDSDIYGAAKAKASERRWRLVGLVGVLHGHLTACMNRPCYAVWRLQKHGCDVCEAVDAVVERRHGRPLP